MNCPKCNKEVNENAKFCDGCGFNIAAGMAKEKSCPDCNTPNQIDARFCTECGYEFVEEKVVNTFENKSEDTSASVEFTKTIPDMKAFTDSTTVLQPSTPENVGTDWLKFAVIAVSAIFVISIGVLIYVVIGINKNKNTVQIPTPSVSIVQSKEHQNNDTHTKASEDTKKPAANTPLSNKTIDTAKILNITSEDKKGKYSIYIKDLSSSKEYSATSPETKSIAGGIIDIPIMYAILKDVNSGALSLDKTLKVGSIAGGTGKLSNQDVGKEYSIKDLIKVMMSHSDNTAANLLIDVLGFDKINSSLKEIGLNNTSVNRKLMDTAAQKKGIENYCSASEIGKLLSDLADKKILSSELCNFALVEMEKKSNTGLDKYLPEGFTISHQTGALTNIFNDAGIITNKADTRAVVVIMTQNADQNTASDIIGKVGKEVVTQLQ